MASTEPFVQPRTASALRSQLVGAWTLQSYMSIGEPPSTSRPLYPMTKHAQGIIMYTPDGYMSAQISIPGQQRFEAATGNESDWAECGKRYFAYSGPFFVTEEEGRVKLRHNMRIGNRPAMVGDIQLRDWRFEDDGKLLILSSEEAKEVRGELRRPELRWRRLEDNTETPPPDLLEEWHVAAAGNTLVTS